MRCHSFLDAHRDHRSIGEAVDDLVPTRRLNSANDVRFLFSRRYLGVLDTPPLQQVRRPVGDVEQTPFRAAEVAPCDVTSSSSRARARPGSPMA